MIRECLSRIREIQRELKRCPKLAMTAPGKIRLGLDMMNQNGEACAILTPEGRDSVFKAGDEAFYCAAFSGGRWEDARTTRESIRLEHPCLTTLLMTQPDFINRQLERETMTASGLIPRFLTFICTPELPDVPLDPPVIPENDFGEWGRLEVLVKAFRLRRGPPGVIEASRDVGRLFAEYENETRARRRDGGDAVDIQSFAARWTEIARKIAAGLHVGEYGAGATIVQLSAATASHAIRISRWFVNRQLEALFMQRNAWLRQRAGVLREKLLTIKSGKATLGELVRAGWSKDEVRKLAERYPSLISIVSKPVSSQGGRPTEYVKAVQ